MFQNILVLSPHTDDGELGCGGTISRFSEEGKNVFLIAFTEMGDERLEREMREATRTLGIPTMRTWCYSFPHRRFPLARQRILEVMLSFLPKPDLVFAPSLDDIHQDHQVIAQECGSRGFRVLDDSVSRLHLLMDQKPNSTYIGYDDVFLTLSAAEVFPQLVVMEYLPGPEYSVDMLCDHGEPLYTIPRLRQTIKEGITTVGVTENNKEIINYCEQIARCLNLHGNVGIQVKANEDGEYRILEVNPRLQGSVALSVASGVNLPYLGVKLALGEEMPRDLKVKWGMKMYRHYEEVFIEEES